MKFLNNWLTKLAEQLPTVYADSASLYAVGTDLTPIASQLPDISMRREEVDIFVCPGFVAVEALFELENEGVETDLEVGFPCFGRPNPFKAHETALLDFTVTVDGQPCEMLISGSIISISRCGKPGDSRLKLTRAHF